MKTLVFIILISIPLLISAQGKKALRTNKVKSKTTTTTSLNKEGNTITFKDSYEEYDKNGNTILKIDYAKDGSIKKKESYEFDSFENVIKQTDFEAKSNKTKITEYKYNAHGEKISELVKDSEGNIIEKVTYTYDSKNLKSERKEIDEKGSTKSIKKITYSFFK